VRGPYGTGGFRGRLVAVLAHSTCKRPICFKRFATPRAPYQRRLSWCSPESVRAFSLVPCARAWFLAGFVSGCRRRVAGDIPCARRRSLRPPGSARASRRPLTPRCKQRGDPGYSKALRLRLRAPARGARGVPSMAPRGRRDSLPERRPPLAARLAGAAGRSPSRRARGSSCPSPLGRGRVGAIARRAAGVPGVRPPSPSMTVPLHRTSRSRRVLVLPAR
jgi:hypothetical protein